MVNKNSKQIELQFPILDTINKLISIYLSELKFNKACVKLNCPSLLFDE